MPPRRKLFPTPDDAETAFYEAFERSDLAAMMAVWAASDDVVCIHPTGPRLTGFEAVRESWAQIFSNGAQLRARTVEVRKFDGQSVAVRSVVEVLTAAGQSTSQTVLATNVYELGDGGWRMVIHHAAPPPEAVAAPPDEPTPSSHTLH